MAAIMPYDMLTWEKLFWFLKFLIPKLKVQDPDADLLDELLESVDLSSYGLQRVKLNHAITLMTKNLSWSHKTLIHAVPTARRKRPTRWMRSSRALTRSGSRAGARHRKSRG